MRFPHDVPTLSDGTVVLRAHDLHDVARVVEQCVDPLTVRWTSVPAGYRERDAVDFVTRRVPAQWADGSELAFAVDVGGEFQGTCSLRDHGHRRAELAFGAHPAARGRGVVDRALRQLVAWAFASGRFDTLLWQAEVGNWPSRRAAWRLGFSCVRVDGWLHSDQQLLDGWMGTLRRTDPVEPRNAWHQPVRIVGDQVVLRGHLSTDAERICSGFVDPVSQHWLRVPAAYPREAALAYLQERQELMASGQAVQWAVADPASDQLLGAVMLFQIEPGRSAELGYWTHPTARGQGLTTEACRLALRHAFVPEEDGGLGVARLTAYVGVDNRASLGVVDRLGFTRYGVERLGGHNGRGEQFDLACHDLLIEEWRALKPS